MSEIKILSFSARKHERTKYVKLLIRRSGIFLKWFWLKCSPALSILLRHEILFHQIFQLVLTFAYVNIKQLKDEPEISPQRF